METVSRQDVVDIFDDITQDMEHLVNTLDVLELGFYNLKNDEPASSTMYNLKTLVELQRSQYLKRMNKIVGQF